MAVTGLSDIITPDNWREYAAENVAELTAFAESGALVRNDILDQGAKGTNDTINVPYWKDLVGAESDPNYSTDNPESYAIPDKVQAEKMAARLSYMNKSWSAADLSSELAGSDPLQRIAARTDAWWARNIQHRLIAITKGILAANKAAGGDMIHEATQTDLEAVIDTAYTLGDHVSILSTIVVHSDVAKVYRKRQEVTYLPDSDGNLVIPSISGMRLVIDDSMPVAAGKYTSVLIGGGAFGYGNGEPRYPAEVDRDKQAGDGGGIETLITRKTMTIHPLGWNWKEVAVTGQSPTLAELATAGNWERKFTRKNIPLAFMVAPLAAA